MSNQFEPGRKTIAAAFLFTIVVMGSTAGLMLAPSVPHPITQTVFNVKVIVLVIVTIFVYPIVHIRPFIN